MGAAVVLLVFLMAATVYANSAYYRATYLPKSPRRPNILVWPSVMNPAVADGVRKKILEEGQHQYQQYEDRYLKLECSAEADSVMEPLGEVEIIEFTEEYFEYFEHYMHYMKHLKEMKEMSETIYTELFPKLILWLSGEVMHCGFYTIFSNERDAIYRFINANRHPWILALHELAIILLQVIAVIHDKTQVPQYGNFEGSFNWLDNWTSAYETWYLHYNDYDHYDSPLDYLETVILDSFDIVTAWLFDYLSERTRESSPTWTLSNDTAIVCALAKYDREEYGPVEDSRRWDFVVTDKIDRKKMKTMAEAFTICQITKGCTYRYPAILLLGTMNRNNVVLIPGPEDCIHICTNIPEKHKNSVLRLAHMTTRAGYELYCSTPEIDEDNVTLQCHPLIVEKYIRDRQNVICKSNGCKLDCCKQPHCEIVTNTLPVQNFKEKRKVMLMHQM